MAAPQVLNRFESTLLINALTADSFQPSGRRSFLSYRDLGAAEATNGAVGAVISRSAGGPGAIQTGWHYHVCDLQLIYMIDGWVEMEFEGSGVVRVEAGTCINIPPGVPHNEIAISPDNEVLEITIPPKIETITLAEAPGPAAEPGRPEGESWEYDAEGAVHLVGGRCAECSTLVFPRPARCPGCLSARIEPARLSRRGTLFSTTTIHAAPAGFDTPYTIGFVDLPEQVRVFAQLRGEPATLPNGCAVTVDVDQIRTDPDGSAVFGYVFKPEDQ